MHSVWWFEIIHVLVAFNDETWQVNYREAEPVSLDTQTRLNSLWTGHSVNCLPKNENVAPSSDFLKC